MRGKKGERPPDPTDPRAGGRTNGAGTALMRTIALRWWAQLVAAAGAVARGWANRLMGARCVRMCITPLAPTGAATLMSGPATTVLPVTTSRFVTARR